MITDPTEEIRAIKHKLSAACDYDIHRIAEEARQHFRDSEKDVAELAKTDPSIVPAKSNNANHP